MLRRALILAAIVAGTDARAETIVVNLSSDEADAAPDDGTADVDLATAGLQVTLRSAIEHANQRAGADEIVFELSSPALMPAALPEVKGELRIDGSLPGGRVQLIQQGLVFRAPGCSVAHLIVSGAPVDAIASLDPGPIAFEDVDLTESAAGLGIRARGPVTIEGAVLTSNALGGVLSAEGSVIASALIAESNGGPGVIALSGIELSASEDRPTRVRGNGAGLYSDGPVKLLGPGLHRINGNSADGIRTLEFISVEGELELLDNASFGARAMGDVFLGQMATISGNGHGGFMIVPDAIELELSSTTVMGERVRGGGVFSALGAIDGDTLIASDNAGPAVLNAHGVSFREVELLRNDGAGIQSAEGVLLGGGRIEGNLGYGVATTWFVEVSGAMTFENNSGAAVFSEHVFLVAGDEITVIDNGRTDRATMASFSEETLEVELEPEEPVRAGIFATARLVAQNLEVAKNGSHGIETFSFELIDSSISDNDGVGLRAGGGGSLIRTTICNNRGGDLIHFRTVTLEDSGACDRQPEEVPPEAGCRCARGGTIRPGAWLLLLALPLLCRRRR